MANIDVKDIWAQVKQSRKEYLRTFTSSICPGDLIPDNDISALVTSVEEKLGQKSDSAVHENITGESLSAASIMLTYLSFCPPKGSMDEAKQELDNSIKIYSPKQILIILNRLIHVEGRNLPFKDAFSKFFDRITEAWHLKYNDIRKLTSERKCEGCKVSSGLVNNLTLATLTNHPVHIVNEDETVSPSSFIPFCWFGNGRKLSQNNELFNVPFCYSFKPKLRNDQVCYEMDPNEFLERGQKANKKVLYFIIDDNKDRQSKDTVETSNETQVDYREKLMMQDGNIEESVVYLDTIGKRS